ALPFPSSAGWEEAVMGPRDSRGDKGLVCVGPVDGDVVEQRQAGPHRPITVEEIEHCDAVVGQEHHFGGPTLSTQRELDDVTVPHALNTITHDTALRITFVTGAKAHRLRNIPTSTARSR